MEESLYPKLPFLFLFISILEESGYMSRVVFLMDKIMRNFDYLEKCSTSGGARKKRTNTDLSR
jgi:hypothetical protein